jgi:hypothetical protein
MRHKLDKLHCQYGLILNESIQYSHWPRFLSSEAPDRSLGADGSLIMADFFAVSRSG